MGFVSVVVMSSVVVVDVELVVLVVVVLDVVVSVEWASSNAGFSPRWPNVLLCCWIEVRVDYRSSTSYVLLLTCSFLVMGN